MAYLVSCVGEYYGSGTGTGGLILVTDKAEIMTIDLIDSTGLYYYEGLIFRIIRKLKLLVVYDKKGIRCIVSVPFIEDAHDILVDNNQIHCVSTGNNKIITIDFLGQIVEEIQLKGKGDAWHVNCLAKVHDELYCTAFGIYDYHRQWDKVDYSRSGIIYNITKQEIVKSGLYGPHNPFLLSNKWYVNNSLNYTLDIYDGDQVVKVDCGGFTRGLKVDNEIIYVGVSSNRKDQYNRNSKLILIDRKSLKIVKEIKIPFPEVYDLLKLDDEWINLLVNKKEHFSLENLIWQVKLRKLTLVNMEKPTVLQKLKNKIKKIRYSL